MAVRSTMAALITKVRSMVNDPSGASAVWSDQDIQDQLDRTRLDIRYELLTAAPWIVNEAAVNNTPTIVWADYYSSYQWWEDDVTLQGNNVSTSAAWVVLTPALSEPINGHWAFQQNVPVSGTAPGQYPPVFATGKSFDVYMAAANILEMWVAKYALAYDVTSDGQSFRRSQIIDGLNKAATIYRKQARAISVQPQRRDLQSPTGAHVEHVPLLGHNDDINRM